MANVILGAGISGLSTAFHLSKNKIEYKIFEKDDDWGGLCGNFVINGYRFDKFIHLSFTKNVYVKKLFSDSIDFYRHKPTSYNYYKGFWLRHPAQNNLFSLPTEIKTRILEGFMNRPNLNETAKITNYEEWLRIQFGDYFAEEFPMKYTRKYWTQNASDLGTQWIGERVYVPSIEEIKQGMKEEDKKNRYYAKEMRYPKKGGFKSFFSCLRKDLKINFKMEATKIDLIKKRISFNNKKEINYERIFSSIPLPEYSKLIDLPDNIQKAIKNLNWSAGIIISIGLNKPSIPKHLWFYIYDEEVLPARVYSPSLKASDNVPKGCSSLQAEIYFNKKTMNADKENLKNSVLQSLVNMEVFNFDDINFIDIREIPYANVIFDHKIYENRSIVIDFLKSNNIYPIGRFGEWDYLWSDQALLSGKVAADTFIN